jgi:glycosyltransferase involved in cell wall biosynthesis
MKSFAYLGSSQEGGTYRVFETLRDGLAERGWTGEFVNETCLPAGALNGSEKEILEALRDHLGGYDLVIGNVFISVRLMNVLRFLPAKTPRVLIVHNITRATYLAARALRDCVQHTVAVSPRIRADLLQRSFLPESTTTIFNAVPDGLFQPPAQAGPSRVVRLLSLGRIEELSKRVFLLPEILRPLDPSCYRLTVAGDGPDRDELIARLHAAAIPFDAPGRIAREDLARVYREHQVFLFPSRFEGQGIAAAEAMASGLVPVASHISGVTADFIEDGKSGFLFNQGDTNAATAHLQTLIADPAQLQAMCAAAHTRAHDLFSVEKMLNAYEIVMSKAASAPQITPCSLTRWRPPLAMGPGLRSFIPTGLRQKLASWIVYK